MQGVLGVEPVSIETWFVVIGLAFTIVPALELHKLTWQIRYGRRNDAVSSTSGRGDGSDRSATAATKD